MTSTSRGAPQLVERPKTPSTVLAGPYGHPFHPILVTVPIGAWITSVLLDIGSMVAEDGGALARAAWWAIGLGVIGALVAAAIGVLDLLRIPSATTARKVALTHMVLNVVVVVTFAVSFLWRMDRGVGAETNAAELSLSIAALVLLGAAGWLGGMLTYRYGVRVATQADQAEGYRPS
jgi:uncharacterized membrane protein